MVLGAFLKLAQFAAMQKSLSVNSTRTKWAAMQIDLSDKDIAPVARDRYMLKLGTIHEKKKFKYHNCCGNASWKEGRLTVEELGEGSRLKPNLPIRHCAPSSCLVVEGCARKVGRHHESASVAQVDIPVVSVPSTLPVKRHITIRMGRCFCMFDWPVEFKL